MVMSVMKTSSDSLEAGVAAFPHLEKLSHTWQYTGPCQLQKLLFSPFIPPNTEPKSDPIQIT